MKSEYELQAEKFCEETGTDYKISYIGKTIHPFWDEKEPRRTFSIMLKRNGEKYNFKFYGNLKGDEIKIYDVLACLTKFDVGDFDDFISEFGYDIESNKDYTRIQKIYKAVVKEYENVIRLFGDVMDELCEIQ